MKKLFYAFSLFALLILFNSCDCKSKPIKFSINENTTETTTYSDFCSSTQAVDMSRSHYNSDTGEGKFQVVFPVGHRLTTITNPRNNKVTFITRGKVLSNNTTSRTVFIDGFKTGSNNSIEVFLEVHYSDTENRCPRVDVLGVKHGNSTIPGDPPLHGVNKK